MTAASTSPGWVTSAFMVTPPPIERPSIASRSASTYGSCLQRLDGVDGVAGVAEPGLAVDRRHRVGGGVAAVVGVQHDEPGPGQRVLLAGQALAGDVVRRVDVAVVEHDPRERALALRPDQHAGDRELVAAVGDVVAGVGVGGVLGAQDPRLAAGGRLPHQRRQREPGCAPRAAGPRSASGLRSGRCPARGRAALVEPVETSAGGAACVVRIRSSDVQPAASTSTTRTAAVRRIPGVRMISPTGSSRRGSGRR